MAISVIGAGFGRTGTHSLKLALERLGFGPCYHMVEVFQNPHHPPLWEAAADGPADWDALLEGYRATVDWPSTFFWRELAAHYPEAKIILTVRDPAGWYGSCRDTIFQHLAPTDEPGRPTMARRLVTALTFDGRLDDEAHAIRVFEEHNARVVAEVPPERLLVFRSADGWEPLCAFLGVPVPDEPYPRTNSTAEFQERVRS